MNYYIYEVIIDGKKRRFLSVLENEQVFEKGLEKTGVIGEITRNDEFIPNGEFLEIFHKIIEEEILKEPSIIEQAERQVSGWIYIVDQRHEKGTEIMPKDIIGGIEVSDKNIVIGTYKKNPNYKLITEKGLFSLPQRINDILLSTLTKNK